MDILNFSFREGTLSDSQCRGVLRLLYKKDDPLLLKNWHPISLLNIDYKIATKALSNRLCKVLLLILSEDQTCVPDRCIFENLFLMRDTIDYVRAKNLFAAIVSLDQEKAFDRVNHGFLQQVLKRFNFGPDFRRCLDQEKVFDGVDWSYLFLVLEKMGFGLSFISWIRLLYYNVRCSVLVNGDASPV